MPTRNESYLAKMKTHAKSVIKEKTRKLSGYNELFSILNHINDKLNQDSLVVKDIKQLVNCLPKAGVNITDYPYSPRTRKSFSHSKIRNIIETSVQNSTARITEILTNLKKYRDAFASIPLTEEVPGEPYWENGWIPSIDGMMIYSTLATKNPRWYVECGSGNTTKFAAKSIRDNNLRTIIISIDPYPRAEIDALCNKIFRIPLEQMDIDFFKEMTNEDIFLVDNSHRAFPNSDVTVFFTEILPILPHGLLYAMHDIALPDECWAERYYNEQYMLTAYLLGGGDGDQIYFPTGYLTNHTSLLDDLKKNMALKSFRLNNFAGFFWMVKN